MDKQQTIDKAISIMENWARDDSHGYDQAHRWGERGDYDCSAAVISAWEDAGVPVKQQGATFTGNMRSAFLRCGFKEVTGMVNLANGSCLKKGDVLLNIRNHTAMYCGDGMEVEASINENGGTTGGQPGDQTGREFLIRPYRNYPWDCVLRYEGEGGTPDQYPPDSPTVPTQQKLPTMCNPKIPEVQKGDRGAAVAACQAALNNKGQNAGEVDGDAGTRTHNAIMAFQAEHGLDPDGVCGKATWTELLK